MFRRILSVVAVISALLFFALPAFAQQRIALVIGNAAYSKGPIATSLADAGLVAEALTSIGFEVVEGADVNQTDLRRLVREFLVKVSAAGPDTIAFVYFSGYGLTFEGDNYLIPIDARLERDSDIPIDAMRLFELLRPLADTQAAAKIVIIDAMRPLPFQIQGGLAAGFGAIVAAPGMIVGFASSPGLAAPDGPGPYGAYATAIAEMVREPGLILEALFARIRVRTAEATNGAQLPWNVSQDIDPQIMLVPGAPAAPPPGLAVGVVTGAPQRPLRDVGPEQAYSYAIESDNLDTYAEYVRVYPSSPYSQRVWAILQERREALAWRRALLIGSAEAFWTYQSRYPNGMYAADAERRLRRLSVGVRPPSGFRAIEFTDVPPPLQGEPTQRITILPSAPPPPRRLGPPPAYIVNLPPPQRSPSPGGLWHRPSPVPVIVAPNTAPRIQRNITIQQQNNTIVTTPPGSPKGTTTTGTPPGPPKGLTATTPTTGTPPGAPKGTTTGTPPGPPKSLTTTTPTTGTPPGSPKGTTTTGTPPGPPKGLTATTPTTGTPPGAPKGTTTTGTPPGPPKGLTTTTPTTGTPLGAAKGTTTTSTPPGPPKGLTTTTTTPSAAAKKCQTVVVNGKEQCKP